MKRKKSAAAQSLSGPRWDAPAAALFCIFLFLVMHLWIERATVWAAFIALAVCVGRTPWRLARERFCVPMIGFLAFMAVYGASAIYSPFGGTAAREFGWMLAAFAVAAPVLLRFEKCHVRYLLWGLAAVSAAVSLLSTDMACEGPLYEGFLSLMGRFGVDTMYADMKNTVGRVSGVYNDANVTGSIFALGTLVSLYLAQTGEKWWKRLLACVLVSTSAVGILLSVSRGAILCFGLSLAVWLIAAGNGQRLRLFLLMIIGAGVSFAAFAPAAAVAPGAALPNLLAVGSGAVIFLLDWAVGERLARLLGRHMKIAAIAMGSVVAAAALFVVAALTLTEPYTFPEGRGLQPGAALLPGEYTLTTEGDLGEACRVYIRKTSDEEAMLGKTTTLYSGPMENVSFTVPEDTNWVIFGMSGEEGDVLRSVTLSDGWEIPLKYTFLPETIAPRMHRGMFSDNSFLRRTQFMKDAWVLFKREPLIGHGLGASDNLYPAIQPFYYQSRYVQTTSSRSWRTRGFWAASPSWPF